jgi:hypothetical protein
MCTTVPGVATSAAFWTWRNGRSLVPVLLSLPLGETYRLTSPSVAHGMTRLGGFGTVVVVVGRVVVVVVPGLVVVVVGLVVVVVTEPEASRSKAL